MHPYVHSSTIYNSQNLEAAQVPISRWVDKKAVVHLHNILLLSHKKEGNLTLCDSMNGPREYYAKWNKPVRERQIPYNFSHYAESNEQNWTNKQNSDRLLDTESRLTTVRREGVEGRGKMVKRLSKIKINHRHRHQYVITTGKGGRER